MKSGVSLAIMLFCINLFLSLGSTIFNYTYEKPQKIVSEINNSMLVSNNLPFQLPDFLQFLANVYQTLELVVKVFTNAIFVYYTLTDYFGIPPMLALIYQAIVIIVLSTTLLEILRGMTLRY